MSLLFLTDIIKRADIDPSKVKLIRHAISDKGFRDCLNAGMIKEYTQQQKKNFSKGYDYWLVFISDKGSLARLEGCYKVIREIADVPELIPINHPHPEWFKGEGSFYILEEVSEFKDYEGRLIIDWGKSTRKWHQKGTTEKPIVAIQANQKRIFSGFENIMLTYTELKEIIEDSITYDSWHIALS